MKHIAGCWSMAALMEMSWEWIEILMCCGLQDILLEEFQALVLQRCVSAGASDKYGQPTPAAQAAAAAVQPILAALAAGGAMVTTSLGRACGASARKRTLKGKAVCAGLQRLLEGSGAEQEALGAWRLLMEVSAHEPAGPSWEFLHSRWAALSDGHEGAAGQQAAAAGETQAALLKVIANAAAVFPPAEASKLSEDLLKVR